jgi:RNA polymerase sigma-70 factor (ECF subfamily)
LDKDSAIAMQSHVPVTVSTLTDAQLAAAVAAHDHDAFRELMRRHNPMLFRTARGILKDDAEAEEALQDAYLSAYRAIGTFRGDARLSTWLTRIVANEALGRLRKRTRSAQVVVLGSEMREDMDADMTSTHAEGPEAAAVRAETRRIVEAKIDALPDVFRSVFVLRALQELSVEETAEVLGIPAATVRTRFFRARSMLRESLSREIDVALENTYAFAGARCERIVAAVMARLESSSP